MRESIWVGFDPREADAFAVTRTSMRNQLSRPIPIRGLVLNRLRDRGLYTRPTEKRGEQLWDVISDAPMSTEFAISRFLVPHLVRQQQRDSDAVRWALFTDCDVMARCNLIDVFDLMTDPVYAVRCVHHVHEPDYQVKMTGQKQTRYSRKNWSSVMLFNVDHPSNDALTPELVNSLPGRDLHRFCWLEDHEIGEMGPEWNYLVGHTALDEEMEPRLVHHTDGTPSMPGYEDAEYAGEWRGWLGLWADRG